MPYHASTTRALHDSPSSSSSVDLETSYERRMGGDNFYRNNSSSTTGSNNSNGVELTEENLLTQVTIRTYDDHDLDDDRAFADVSHKLGEVNTAYKNIDLIIQNQGTKLDAVLHDTEEAKGDTQQALNQLREADKKAKYIKCTKRRICCSVFVGIILLIVVGVLIKVINDR